jgi:hypothetical protein
VSPLFLFIIIAGPKAHGYSVEDASRNSPCIRRWRVFTIIGGRHAHGNSVENTKLGRSRFRLRFGDFIIMGGPQAHGNSVEKRSPVGSEKEGTRLPGWSAR